MTTLKEIQKLVSNKTLLLGSLFLLGAIVIYSIISTVITSISPPKVKTFSLQTGQDINIISGNILTVTFNKRITDEEKKNINITIDPEAKIDQLWNPLNTQVTLSNEYPLPSLKTNQVYTVNIRYKNELINQLTFHTVPYDSLTQKQQFIRFKEGQDALHQDAKRIITERPWTQELPIIKENYLIFWDDTTSTIQVQVYAKKAKIDSEQKLNQIKQEVVLELGQKGVDTNNEKINYTMLQL